MRCLGQYSEAAYELLHLECVRSMYSSCTDDQLDMLVSDIQRQYPNAGNRQMYGFLLARGVRVQHHRVRECQRRVDPEGSFLRRLHRLYRRRYSVSGPQHLWHIDGNHKLIRYGTVFFNAIDTCKSAYHSPVRCGPQLPLVHTISPVDLVSSNDKCF